MATMEDIAKKLSISKSTVSKGLSGAADVSETMRKSILEAAVELGYNRTMRRGDAPRFVVFIENMVYESPEDFGYDIILGFRKMAEPDGNEVVIEPLSDMLEKQFDYDTYMLEHNYAGAMFLGMTLSDPWLRQLKHSRTPAVLYDNYVKVNPTTAYIGVDNFEAMRLSVSYLKKLGHRKIGYLSGALGSYINQQRYSAFFQALRTYQMPDSPSLAGNSYYFSECLQTHFPRLLQQGVTAILCSHDLMAHTLMIHAQERGLVVPRDLSIIGFDDLPLCAHTYPPMTTIRQEREEIGRSAYYALRSLMGGIPISTLLLHAKLMTRQSAGPAPDTLPAVRLHLPIEEASI